MRINAVDNIQSKSSFKARLSIVGDQTLLSKEQLGALTQKAKKLGGNGDLVMFGITRCASRTPNQYVVPAEYEEVKDKEIGSHTLLAGICHTFFEINNPPAFIQKIGDIYGTKAERAQKSFDIIDGFLDNIEAELSKK